MRLQERTLAPCSFTANGVFLCVVPGLYPVSLRQMAELAEHKGFYSNPVRHRNKNKTRKSGPIFVPGQGFEPQFSDSESDVLPLDDPGIIPDTPEYI